MNKSPNVSRRRRSGYKGDRGRRWQIRTLINREGGLCQGCGEQVDLVEGSLRQATRDHVVPLSRGGSDLLSNLALLCAECNSTKGSEVPE